MSGDYQTCDYRDINPFLDTTFDNQGRFNPACRNVNPLESVVRDVRHELNKLINASANGRISGRQLNQELHTLVRGIDSVTDSQFAPSSDTYKPAPLPRAALTLSGRPVTPSP